MVISFSERPFSLQRQSSSGVTVEEHLILMKPILIFSLEGIPIVEPGDNIGALIADHQGTNVLQDDDVIVVAHTIVSRAENRVVRLEGIIPSQLALSIASESDKDPRHVETVLKEAKSIVRMSGGILITETKQGFVCANSGVDKSNSPGETVLLHPLDADVSARRIKETIKEKLGVSIAVIISDTFGRPLRVGTTNVAIGISGLSPILDFRGEKDLFGYVLETTLVARADELAAAAGLIMGQAGEGYPVVVIRGAIFRKESGSAKELNRPQETALFW